MSDGEYAEMIEIPVSTCEMVITPKKRKKRIVKQRVIESVNRKLESERKTNFQDETKTLEALAPQKKKMTFNVVTVQVVAIFLLVLAILLTNIFWADSGINNLLRTVFKIESKSEIDTRTYKGFDVSLPTKSDEVQLEAGVMTVKNEGSVYSPCAGVVGNIESDNGKYTITIEHSDLFKTVIKNVDYAYFDVGETVFQAVPVCYSCDGGVEVLMYNDNALLTNYIIKDGNIVWQS